MARTRLGWLMALFFGLQSLQAYSIFGWFAELYRDAGFSAHTAGLLLGVITGVSIPLSILIPWLVGAQRTTRPLLMCAGDGVLPGRLRRSDPRPARGCPGLGDPRRHRNDHVPADPHPDRAARPHPERDGRALGLRPVDRLPDRRRPARSPSGCCTSSPAAGRCRCSPCWRSRSRSCCWGWRCRGRRTSRTSCADRDEPIMTRTRAGADPGARTRSVGHQPSKQDPENS